MKVLERSIPRELIEEGERRRKEYGDIKELANSITQQGLINPITVKKTDNMTHDGFETFLLLAGGRRLAAMTDLGWADIPCRVFDRELTDLEIRSIELAENIDRKDLEWPEKIALQKEIHDLQIEIHGERPATTLPGAAGWSAQDTAELLGRSEASISRDLRLASEVEANPEAFSGAKNKSDAQKIIKQKDEQAILAELSKRVTSSSSSKSGKLNLINSYQVRDFFQGVTEIEDGTMNLVEIDPPYAVEYDKLSKAHTENLGEYQEISAAEYPKFLADLFRQCHRVMAEHAWIICWHAQAWTPVVYKAMKEAGFDGTPVTGVWVKPNGACQQPNYMLANTTEHFFYMRKGKPAIAKPGRANTFIYSQVPAQQKTHPTERPIEMIKEVLATFGSTGHRVLVPFAGSGNTLIAAHQLGMSPIGYDLSSYYKDSYTVRVHKL